MAKTHVLIGGVSLAVEMVTDCKNATEFKALIAEKTEAGGVYNFGKTPEEVYQIVMDQVNADKPKSGKTPAQA